MIEKAQRRYARLEEGKRTGLFVAIGKRFFEIDGLDLAALMALELFTVVIPLMLIGFSWASRFASDLSLGDLLITELHLTGKEAKAVHDSFSSSADLKSTWTVIGLLGWLLWGIPTSWLMARIFSKAWKREAYGFVKETLRGFSWFFLYILAIVATERLRFVSQGVDKQVLGYLASLVLFFGVWYITPMILLRRGTIGWRSFLLPAVAATLINEVVLRIAVRIVLPMLIGGWTSFGPIGTAMALMTWCGVVGIAWVVTASTGAVLWERSTSAREVLRAQLSVAEETALETQFDPAERDELAARFEHPDDDAR